MPPGESHDMQGQPGDAAAALRTSGGPIGGRVGALISLVLGAVIAGVAIWLDSRLQPPMWVHLVITVPATVAVVALVLRRLGKSTDPT